MSYTKEEREMIEDGYDIDQAIQIAADNRASENFWNDSADYWRNASDDED